MRYETKIVRIGEWLGPVDPDYDWSKNSWGEGKGGRNPDCIERGRKQILLMSESKDKWYYDSSGMSSFPIVKIGMYDGWPFWEPTPTVGYVGPLGAIDMASFYSLGPGNCTTRNPSIRIKTKK